MRKIQENLREIHNIGSQTRERLVTAESCPLLTRYSIGHLGFTETVDDEFHWIRRNHPMSIVLICFAGRGHVWAGGKWIMCEPGTAYLAPPHVLHGYYALKEVHWHLCWVTFTTSGEQKPIIALSTPTLIQLDPEPLQNIIHGLYRECIGDRNASAIHHWSSLLHLHVEHLTSDGYDKYRLHRLWEAVDADLVHSWRLPELAQLACTSSESLRLWCHHSLGRSPMQQVCYLRMQRASYLLRTTQWAISMVAHSVGYRNAFAFSDTFKHWMGVSPSQYRQ